MRLPLAVLSRAAHGIAQDAVDAFQGEHTESSGAASFIQSAGTVTQKGEPTSSSSPSPKFTDWDFSYGDDINPVNEVKEQVMEGMVMYPGHSLPGQPYKERVEKEADISKGHYMVLSAQPRVSMTPEKAAEIFELIQAYEHSRPIGGIAGPPPEPTEPTMVAMDEKIYKSLDKEPSQDEEVKHPTIAGTDTQQGRAIANMEHQGKAKLGNRSSAVPSEYPDHIKRHQDQSKHLLSDNIVALINSPIRLGGAGIQPRHEECTSIGCEMQKSELAAFLITIFVLGGCVFIGIVAIFVKYSPKVWALAKSKIGGRRRNSEDDRNSASTDIESQTLGSASELVKKPKNVRFPQF